MWGIVLHTMFYETEIRREDEYRVSSQVADKELEMALLLVNNLVVAFDGSKYRDGYRDKLDELIQAKLQARTVTAAEQRRPAPVVNILDALQRSLESNRCPPASQTLAAANNKMKNPGQSSGRPKAPNPTLAFRHKRERRSVKTQHENADSAQFCTPG